MGTCLDRNGAFYCVCPSGYTGTRCQVMSSNNHYTSHTILMNLNSIINYNKTMKSVQSAMWIRQMCTRLAQQQRMCLSPGLQRTQLCRGHTRMWIESVPKQRLMFGAISKHVYMLVFAWLYWKELRGTGSHLRLTAVSKRRHLCSTRSECFRVQLSKRIHWTIVSAYLVYTFSNANIFQIFSNVLYNKL